MKKILRKSMVCLLSIILISVFMVPSFATENSEMKEIEVIQ